MAGQGRPRASRSFFSVTAHCSAAIRRCCADAEPHQTTGTGASLSGTSKADSRRRATPVPVITTAAILFLLLSTLSYADDAMMVRVAWGGGSEKMWEGSIAVTGGTVSQPRPLGIEADEPGSMWLDGGRLMVRQRSRRAYDGVDLIVAARPDAKLVVLLTASGDAQRGAPIEIPLADLLGEFHNRELDKQGNRLLVRRSPGDALLFRTARSSLVFSPGETLQGEIVPHALPWPSENGQQVKMQLLDGQQRVSWSSTTDLSGGNAEPIAVDVKLPDEEGVYDLVVSAQPRTGRPRGWRSSLQWKRPTVERRVQLLVVGQKPPAPNAPSPLEQVWEIDPATSRWWEKVKPQWPRFARGALAARALTSRESAPLGNGMRETIHHPLGDLSQLKPNAASPDVSWEAYSLTVTSPGKPHALEIDYPSNLPQTLGISILETNAADMLVPIGLDSGVDVSEEAASATPPHWEHHRLVFWPRTSSPLLLITNRRQQSPAVYGKIRVLAGGEHLAPLLSRPDRAPTKGSENARGQRLVAAYMDRPLLPENFSADEVLDTWSGRTLHDWRTFHQAGTRLVEYLHYAGYNGLMLTVAADGSAIYPTQVLQATPRYDTGAFFASGQDPMPKDVLEMLLRLTDREGLQVIASMEFAAPLPELEAIRRRGGKEAEGLEWIGADGNTWCQTYVGRRGLAPYYNTLDPRVQEAMLSAVRELVARYAGHASFRGVALRLSAYGYAQLPGAEWGMDDATIARFQRDCGQEVPGEGERRFAARAAFLTSDEHCNQWLQWRARECHRFYHRVQEVLASAQADLPLYLAGAEMLAGPDFEAEVHPGLLRQTTFGTALLQAGIDPALYRDGKVVLLRSQRLLIAAPVTAQANELDLNQSSEADTYFRGLCQRGSFFFHPPLETRIPSFDQKAAIRSSGLLLLSQVVPAGGQNRQRFVESIARHDAQFIIDGGWTLPLGQEEATKHLLADFQNLPTVAFADAEESRSGQSVLFRWASHQGQTYAYAVNNAPFAVTARVRVATSANCRLEDLSTARGCVSALGIGELENPSGRGRAGQLQTDNGGLLWNISLSPHDFVAVRLSEPDARLYQAEVTVPDDAGQWIARRIRDLGARAAALRTPSPMPNLENADFQAKPTEAEPVPGWQVSKGKGVSIATEAAPRHADGKDAQAVKITSDGPVACLVSHPFAPPRSGRLAISVWLKVADAAAQPQLRLAVEGRLAGRDYYRYAVLGQSPGTGQRASPIESTWQRFIVPFNDLPSDGMTQLRVRLDLMGAGVVWADDIQLFDLAFNESELRALCKLLTLADVALQNGEAGESLKILWGYWPRFLEENVPLPPPAPMVAAQPPAAPPASEPAPSSGWFDRIKGILPERWR